MAQNDDVLPNERAALYAQIEGECQRLWQEHGAKFSGYFTWSEWALNICREATRVLEAEDWEARAIRIAAVAVASLEARRS